MLSLTAQFFFIASLTIVPQEGAQEKQSEQKSLPRQPGDDVVKPLNKPLPQDVKNRVEAESWFMTGRVEQRAGRIKKAYDAYKKALELDPDAVAIHRELIPLCFQLNQVQEGAEYARKAAELDPDDYQVLQQLSVIEASANRMDQAIVYIEKALKSKRLKEFSPEYVILNRDLVRLCGAARKLDRAADGCDVLFAALKAPDKYGLDARGQRELAGQTDLIGSIYAASGNLDKAIAVFKEQARVRQNQPGTHNLSLARMYFQKRDFDAAQKELELFFKTKPRELLPYQMYQQLLIASDRKDQVVSKFEELQKENKRNSTLAYFLGQLYIEAGRLGDAEGLIKKTIMSSGNPIGYLSLTEIHRRQKDADALLDALVKATDADVDLPPVLLRSIGNDKELTEKLIAAAKAKLSAKSSSISYRGNFALGQIASTAERTDDAVQFYRSALQLGRADQIPQVSLELGTALLFDDKYKEAAEVLDNAVKQRPQNEEQKRRYVFLLYRLAQAREFGDETDKAVEALKRAQAMPEGNLPLIHYQEGWTYFHARQVDKAEEKLQFVLEQFRNDPDTLKRTRMLLASVHSQQRNFGTAIAEFEAIINDYSGEPDTVRSARMSLSGLYISKGDQPKAEAILEVVLKDDPEDPGVNNDLGYLYADQNKKLELAEKMIRKAVKAQPENAAYLDSLGWVLFRREKYKEAIEYLEKAIALPDGADSTIVEHLGDNYEKIGNADEAMKKWKRALDIETSAAYPDETVVERLEKKVETGKSEPEKK